MNTYSALRPGDRVQIDNMQYGTVISSAEYSQRKRINLQVKDDFVCVDIDGHLCVYHRDRLIRAP